MSTMQTKNKRYEAFENLAKEMGASFSTNPDDLTEGQRATLDAFRQELRSLGSTDSPLFTPGEKFHMLAEQNDLSVDEGDIELFLAVEISQRIDTKKITKKTLSNDTSLRKQAIESALERVFAGIEHTRISQANRNALWMSAAEVASETMDTFWPGVFRNPSVNTLRKELMDIYERFLIWMRKVRDGLLALSTKDRDRVEALMKKAIEILNICYMLGLVPIPSDPLVQKLLASDKAKTEGLGEYEKVLAELEDILPSRLEEKSLRNLDRWLD